MFGGRRGFREEKVWLLTRKGSSEMKAHMNVCFVWSHIFTPLSLTYIARERERARRAAGWLAVEQLVVER